MTAQQALAQASRAAEQSGRPCYVYAHDGIYGISDSAPETGFVSMIFPTIPNRK